MPGRDRRRLCRPQWHLRASPTTEWGVRTRVYPGAFAARRSATSTWRWVGERRTPGVKHQTPQQRNAPQLGRGAQGRLHGRGGRLSPNLVPRAMRVCLEAFCSSKSSTPSISRMLTAWSTLAASHRTITSAPRDACPQHRHVHRIPTPPHPPGEGQVVRGRPNVDAIA